MPDDTMTLQEALQTDEVQAFIGAQIREVIAQVLPDALESGLTAQMPTIRESVSETLQQDGQARELHGEALRLLEAARLPTAAKANLLEDYGLNDDGDELKLGRGLMLIEAQVDDDGKVVKSARAVLREAVEADIARTRNVLRESAPSVPFAPGSGSDSGQSAAQPTLFLGDSSPVAQRLREKGLDPALFGATPKPAETTTT